MTGKYQNGPWEAERVGREGNPNDPLHYVVRATAFGRSVVVADTLNCSCIFGPEDQEANAVLLAAALDMLAALEAVKGDAAFIRLNEKVCAQVSVALAKTRGA